MDARNNGLGQGNWERQSRKAIVDESLTLSIFGLNLEPGMRRKIAWKTRLGEPAGSISYLVEHLQNGRNHVILMYSADGKPMRQFIPLDYTVPRFGGRRAWFLCPRCRRRSGKLHVPPGALTFACRVCHGLSHWSAQTAHQLDRILRRTGQLIATEYLDRLRKSEASGTQVRRSRPAGASAGTRTIASHRDKYSP